MLGEVPEWVPVLAPGGAADGSLDRAAVESRAAELELVGVRWPDRFPFDSRTAMLAATYAKQSGRAVAFSLAAMRQAFAAGRDLSVVDNVLIAAAACEIHPRALLKGIELRMVAEDLERASAAAPAELPAVVTGERSLCGHAALSGANLL